MDYWRFISYAIVIAFGLIMTGMFYLIHAQGIVYVGELILWVRYLELSVGVIIVGFGIWMFIRELRRM
jgi:hypothetical protein